MHRLVITVSLTLAFATALVGAVEGTASAALPRADHTTLKMTCVRPSALELDATTFLAAKGKFASATISGAVVVPKRSITPFTSTWTNLQAYGSYLTVDRFVFPPVAVAPTTSAFQVLWSVTYNGAGPRVIAKGTKSFAAVRCPAIVAVVRTPGDGYTMMDRSGRLRGFGGGPNQAAPTSAAPFVAAANSAGTVTPFLANANGHVVVPNGAPSADPGRNKLVPVGIAATPSGNGYWLVDAHGRIVRTGDALAYGDRAGKKLTKPIVGIASTAGGHGYWLVSSDGGVFAFGAAGYYGSKGAVHLNRPIIGIASTPGGRGYWLVASDGGVFTYGTAGYYGSTGGVNLHQPIVGLTPTESGRGYWLVDASGGVFAFGNAKFHGTPTS